MEQQITLEDRMKILEGRVEYQDYLHRHIGPDGNVRHFYNLLPTMIVAAVVGAVGAAIICRYLWARENNI